MCEAAARHRKYEHHLHNLRKIKPSIDNRDPRRPRSSNAAGARMEEERNNQIMHENTILLNKLSRILTREPPQIREPMLKRGLNENHKKGERERIDRENQALLRRLQDVRPSIDAEKNAEQYDLHLDLLARHQATWVPNPFLHNTAPNRRPMSAMSSASGGYAGGPPAAGYVADVGSSSSAAYAAAEEAEGAAGGAVEAPSGADPLGDINAMLGRATVDDDA